MSFSTSIPRTVTSERSHPLVVIVTVAAFIVASTWAITSSGTDPRVSRRGQALTAKRWYCSRWPRTSGNT